MEFSLDFATYTKWSIYLTIAFFVLASVAFVLKWGIRFRLVGAAGFMVVLTIGLFGLSLGLFSHPTIEGAVRYNLVYDNSANQIVIAVPQTITEEELEATLKQAASNFFSYGRTGLDNNDRLTIRARVLLHPDSKTTKPLYIGQVQRDLSDRENANLDIKIFPEQFAQLNVNNS